MNPPCLPFRIRLAAAVIAGRSALDVRHAAFAHVIRWNDDPEILITNALKPATISQIELDHANRKALVLVEEDQLSLAIGRMGQNVRLASTLCGWDIDLMTRAELEATLSTDEAGAAAAAGKAAARQADDGDGAPSPAVEKSEEKVNGTPVSEPVNDETMTAGVTTSGAQEPTPKIGSEAGEEVTEPATSPEPRESGA